MLLKQKKFITSQKLRFRDFWRIVNSVLNKGKSTIPPLFNFLEVLSSVSDKAKLFTKTFSENSDLDDSSISLRVFPSKTNMKLHISVTPKIAKKVIRNLDLSKASDGSEELWAWTFIHTSWTLRYVSERVVFQIAGSFSRWSLYLRMLGKGSLLSVVSKVFEIRVIIRLLIT